MAIRRIPIYTNDFGDGIQDLPVLSGNGTVSETGGALVVSAPSGQDLDWYTFGRHGKLPYVPIPVAPDYTKVYYEFTIRSWTTANPSTSHLVATLFQSDTVLWVLGSGDGVNFFVLKNWGSGVGSIATTLPRKFRFVWDRSNPISGSVTVQYQVSAGPDVWADIVTDQSIGMAPIGLGFGLKNYGAFPACAVQYDDTEIYAENYQILPSDPLGVEDRLLDASIFGYRTSGALSISGVESGGQTNAFEDRAITGTELAGSGALPADRLRNIDNPEGVEDASAVRLGLVPAYRPSANDPEGRPYFLETLGSPRLRASFLYDATRDPWNDPTTYGLSGYARDGYYYVSGAKQGDRFLDRFDNGVVDLATDIPAGGHVSESGGRLSVYLLPGEQGDWFNGAQQSPVAYTNLPAAAFANEVQEYTTRLSGLAGSGTLTVGMVLWSTRTNAYLFDINSANVLAVSTLIGGSWTQGVAIVTVADPNTTPLTLKIERHTGTALLRFMYSADNGATWSQLYSATAGFAPTRIGLFAKNFTTYPAVYGYFDYLRIASAAAPWATEVAGADRGSRPDFPVKSLLVTSQSELVVFDLDNWPASVRVWMRFRLGDASNFYLLGRVADSLRAARMLNGTLMAGSQNNGIENGGLFCIDFKRTGTDFALLVRSDGWWNGTSGRNITHRNQAGDWAGQGTGFTLDSEYVHYVDAALDTGLASRERMWVVAGSEDLIRIVEILANQPQFDYKPAGALVGPSDDFASGLKCSLFDAAGWLWLGWGPYVFRAIADFRGGVVVMGGNAGSPETRHRYVQLLHPSGSVVVKSLTQVNESVYAATSVGVYRINRFTMDAYLCYTVSGGLGGGRLNRPPAGELLGGDSKYTEWAKGFVVNRAGRPIGYLAVASAQATFSPSLPTHGRGAVTLIRTYDDSVIDRRVHTGLSSGLTEDGAWFFMPFGT